MLQLWRQFAPETANKVVVVEALQLSSQFPHRGDTSHEHQRLLAGREGMAQMADEPVHLRMRQFSIPKPTAVVPGQLVDDVDVNTSPLFGIVGLVSVVETPEALLETGSPDASRLQESSRTTRASQSGRRR